MEFLALLPTVVLLTFCYSSLFHTVVVAYDDLRFQGCRAAAIRLDQIPKGDVEWYGEISLQLLCEYGFDHPYNFNPDDSTDKITCKGSSNQWVPDFLPDCNKIVVPKSGKVCPKGTALVTSGAKKRCRGCPIGQYLDNMGVRPACKPCAKGYYQDEPLSHVCKLCPYLSLIDVWAQVKKLTTDRQFHVLGCPVVKTLSNGTHVVIDPKQGFAQEMRDVEQSREQHGILNKVPKSGSSSSSWNQSVLMRELWAFSGVLILMIAAMKI